MKKNKIPGIIRRPALVLVLVFAVSRAGAEITLPAIISSNMVLQQNSRIQLWGRSSLAQQVTLQCSWDTVIGTADCDGEGKWNCSITTPASGGPYTITISDTEDELVIENVMIGEVWFCSGQSNMEFPMGISDQYWHTGAIGYEKDIPEVDYPNIRLFTVKKHVAEKPVDDCNGEWLECRPEAANM